MQRKFEILPRSKGSPDITEEIEVTALDPALQGVHGSPKGYSEFTQKAGLLHRIRYWVMAWLNTGWDEHLDVQTKEDQDPGCLSRIKEDFSELLP